MYFTKITATYTPKNNAHSQAQQHALAMDRQLINDEDLESFLEDFKKAIAEIFHNNPRCEPKKPYISRSVGNELGFNKDYSIIMYSNFTMAIYKAEKTYPAHAKG